MKTQAIWAAVLSALVAGCVSEDEKQLDLLMRRTQDLNGRLQVAEEGAKDLTARLERLQSLYADLAVRHKDLQFEVGLLRTRSQPFAGAEDERKAQERMMEILQGLGTGDEKEWPKNREELVALGHLVVPHVLEIYKSQGMLAMTRAGEVLRAIRDPRALAPLVVGLQHPKTRGISAEALGRLGVKKAAKDLGPFLTDEKPDIRLRTAEAMGELGDLSGVPILIEWLEHDKDTDRLLSFTTLKRLTNQTFDYDPYGADADRKAAAAQWKKWWTLNKSRFDLSVDLEAGLQTPGGTPGSGPEKPPGKSPEKSPEKPPEKPGEGAGEGAGK
jgi:hypothetical protein